MKKSIWIKGSEIRKMTNNQIANYEFNARISDPDEPSDHELIKQLAINQASDHELLINLAKSVKSDHDLLLLLVKDMKDVKTRLTNVEDVLKRNNLH